LQALETFAIIRALRQSEQNVMVASMGPLATIDGKFRQAWKGATVAIDSCAGVWLVGVHHQFSLFLFFSFLFLSFYLYDILPSAAFFAVYCFYSCAPS